jgi:hypothetical protein
VPAQAVAEEAKKRDRSVRTMQMPAGTCVRAQTCATGLPATSRAAGLRACLLAAARTIPPAADLEWNIVSFGPYHSD